MDISLSVIQALELAVGGALVGAVSLILLLWAASRSKDDLSGAGYEDSSGGGCAGLGLVVLVVVIVVIVLAVVVS